MTEEQEDCYSLDSHRVTVTVDTSNISLEEDSSEPESQAQGKNASISTGATSENNDEGVRVYDISGKVVLRSKELHPLLQHQAEKRSKLGDTEKRGPRCTSYYDNSLAHTNSRANHLAGMQTKMQDLKVCTGNNILLIHYKDYGTTKVDT